MLDVDEIRAHLRYMILLRLAHETGVDRGTLIRIRDGLATRPSHSVIRTLSAFLMGLRNDR